MSRLSKRVERLEEGPGGDTDIWFVAPDSWSEAEREAAAYRLAQERGLQPPFSLIWIGNGGREDAALLYAGPRPDPAEVWKAIAARNASKRS